MDINADDVQAGLSIPYLTSDGSVFVGTYYAGSVAAGTGTIKINLTTGALPTLVLINAATDSVLTNLKVYEEGTYSGGQLILLTNTNRTSSRANPTANLVHGATINTPGTAIIDRNFIGTVGSGRLTFVSSSEGLPFILKPLTNYYVLITNLSGAQANYPVEILLAGLRQ